MRAEGREEDYGRMPQVLSHKNSCKVEFSDNRMVVIFVLF